MCEAVPESASWCRLSGEIWAMTKAELIEEVSRVTESTFREAGAVVEVILDSVVQALRNDERVELRAFGTFGTRRRRARRGRNPRTGEEVDVPAKSIAIFRPSKELKRLIQDSSRGEGEA
jgi:nucleoid DNA-binding protein